MTKRKGTQTDLSVAIGKLVGKLDRSNKGAYTQNLVAQAWNRIVGTDVLAHTTGAHLKEGEMVVYVDSPMWATELSSLSEQYRQAVNAEIGKNAVKSIRFNVSRKVSQQKLIIGAEEETDRFYERDKTKPLPLNTAEMEQILESTKEIEDPELREAVVKATVVDLQMKKGQKHLKSR